MWRELKNFLSETIGWILLASATVGSVALLAVVLAVRFVVPISAILFAIWLMFFGGWDWMLQYA